MKILTKSQLNVLARVGVSKCLEAAALYLHGNGSTTIGFVLGINHRTASCAIDVGLNLPVVR